MTARKPARQAPKPLDFALMQKRVEDAMQALPRSDPPSAHAEYVAELAESYAQARFDRILDAAPCTERQLKSKLLTITKQSKELLISLMTLEDAARDALWRSVAKGERSPEAAYLVPPSMMELHKGRPTVGEMMTYLQRFADAASAPIILEDAVKKGKGPDAKMLPREIAKLAARDFCRLTGNSPDLSKNRHAFRYFLGAVFSALELLDSVSDHAAEAVRWWNEPDTREEIFELNAVVRK